MIDPSEVSRVERNKQNLTIYTNFKDLDKEKIYSFKFTSQEEARSW